MKTNNELKKAWDALLNAEKIARKEWRLKDCVTILGMLDGLHRLKVEEEARAKNGKLFVASSVDSGARARERGR